jgi:hypothetical protein
VFVLRFGLRLLHAPKTALHPGRLALHLLRRYTQSGATPLALFALLLLRAPLVFTLRTLLALPLFGVRSHQLAAESYTAPGP